MAKKRKIEEKEMELEEREKLVVKNEKRIKEKEKQLLLWEREHERKMRCTNYWNSVCACTLTRTLRVHALLIVFISVVSLNDSLT